jgi:hypothetical protein
MRVGSRAVKKMGLVTQFGTLSGMMFMVCLINGDDGSSLPAGSGFDEVVAADAA